MKTLQDYTFTDAALKIDLPRIIREAEGTEARRGRPLPCLLRVTINGTGNQVVTLVHRECFEGFVSEGNEQTVARVLNYPRLPVDRSTNVVRLDGELGVIAYVADPESPEGSADWIAVLGDHVKEFADRVAVRVEVF
jgi:hypothetical protein